MSTIAKLLRASDKIEVLNLRGNSIGDASIPYLASALVHNHWLEEIDL
jgi:hypothetical protein